MDPQPSFAAVEKSNAIDVEHIVVMQEGARPDTTDGKEVEVRQVPPERIHKV
jgi:hypothetical protein